MFHICTSDAEGGLSKYSFLCPNGTIFNQEYFICDWWFNVDCSESAALAEAKNGELQGAREEASAALAEAGEDYEGGDLDYEVTQSIQMLSCYWCHFNVGFDKLHKKQVNGFTNYKPGSPALPMAGDH